MGRKILEWQHISSGKSDDALGIAGTGEFAEATQNRNEIFKRAIVIHNNNQWPVGIAPQKHEQQGLGCGRKSGNTNTPRALPQVGGNTREGGKHFYIREEFADEGKQHAFQF